MHGLLNKYPVIKKPVIVEPFSYQLAALLAMMETANKMQPSGKLKAALEVNFIDSCTKVGWNREVFNKYKR